MPTHNPLRQHRIDYEITVDCYDESEVNMGWFIYFDDGLEFPFPAVARLRKRGGGEEEKHVQVVEVDPKSEDGPMRLGIVEGENGRVQYISPTDLVSADTSPENLEIINDWLYDNDFDLLSSQ